MYLKQKLETTESERDEKVKEILQLRQQLDHLKNQHSFKRRSSTATIVENIFEEANANLKSKSNTAKTHDVLKTTQKLHSNVKVRSGTNGKKRTFLPTVAASNIHQKTKETVT